MKRKILALSWLSLFTNCDNSSESTNSNKQPTQEQTIPEHTAKMIQENFDLYKKHIAYPHDTIQVSREYIPENPYEKIQTITVAMGKPGKIIINTEIDIQEVDDNTILHELTHTLKDSIVTPINPNYVLKDSNTITGISGLTFTIQRKDWQEAVFGIIEEWVAEYIAYSIKPTEEFINPRYYAIGYFMRVLWNHKIVSPKDLSTAIKYDDYTYIIDRMGLNNNPERGDMLLGIFTEVYGLWIGETDYREIQKKVDLWVEKHLKF